MLKKICLLLISLNLGLFFSFGDTLRLTHDGNVRVEPSANSSVIQAVKKDSHIEGYIYNKDWYKVSLGTKKGYLHRTVAAVELIDVKNNYILKDYDSSELSIRNQCWIYKPFVKFIEFHPRWSVIIGIILCVISFVIVFILLENLPFKILRILCVLFIIFTIIGMFGSCNKPSTIKTSWENTWSLFDGHTYEITESEFIYKDKEEHSITFPYKIKDDVICLSPATKGDFGLLPPIEREFQYVKQGRFLTLFFDIPEKCISTASKEMYRIGVLGAIGDVIVPAVAVIVAVLTNNDSNTQGFTSQDNISSEKFDKLTLNEKKEYVNKFQEIADKAAVAGNKTTYERSLDHGLKGILKTKNGGLDFSQSPYLYKGGDGKAIVWIKMSGQRPTDFNRANEAAGFKETPDGYLWHHVDLMKLRLNDYGKLEAYCPMQLVEKKAHEGTGHFGSFGQYKEIFGKYYKE